MPPAVLVQPVGIAELPYEYRGRVVQVLRNLRYLRVLVPEAHDFALSKLAAGRMNDFQAIEDMHRREPLDYETLLNRYLGEMRWSLACTPHDVVDDAVLTCIDMLFGARQRAEAARRLAANRRRY